MSEPKTQTSPAPERCAVAAGSALEDEILSREELLRRYRNQIVWHRSFAECLDGIKAIRCLPGAGIDGCRMPDEIRRIVETLAHYCPITWEHGYMGSKKTPNVELSHSRPEKD